LQSSEVERARQVWHKKFGRRDHDASAATAPDASQRSREMRFLASRGFSGDTIRRVVSGADDVTDEPAP